MPSYKLTYFDMAGRAEAARLAFTLGKIEFEDVRVSFPDWAEKVKPEMPLGEMPCLEIDGVQHVQSTAIMTFAARLANLYPEDTLEAFYVDELLQCADVFTQALIPTLFLAPEEATSAREELCKDGCRLAKLFTYINSKVSENVKENGFAVGKVRSIADVVVFVLVKNIMDGHFGFPKELVTERAPELLKIYETLLEDEQIKEYYEK